MAERPLGGPSPDEHHQLVAHGLVDPVDASRPRPPGATAALVTGGSRSHPGPAAPKPPARGQLLEPGVVLVATIHPRG